MGQGFLFDEPKTVINKKKKKVSIPFKMHLEYIKNYKKCFPNSTLKEKPTGKDLRHWKNLCDTYGEEKIEVLISYVFDNFSFLQSKLNLYSIGPNVFESFSQIFFQIKDGIVKNSKDTGDRAEESDSYNSSFLSWGNRID